MSKKRWLFLIIFTLCLSLSTNGCGLQALLQNKEKTSLQKSWPETVMAVALDEEYPNKLLIRKGIDDLARNKNVQIKYLDLNLEDVEGQLKGAKVLIDQSGKESLLESAQKENIPFIAINHLPAGVKAAGIVMPDQERKGELMAQLLVNQVTEGQVVILQENADDLGIKNRLAGSKTVFNNYPQISVHNIMNTPGAEAETKRLLDEFLRQNPDKVKGILVHTDTLAALATDALQQNRLIKKVCLIGGQACMSSMDRIANGIQAGDIDDSPYLLGETAFHWAQKVMANELLDADDIVTGEQGDVPVKKVPVKAVAQDNIGLIQKSYSEALQSAAQAQENKREDKGEDKEKQSSQEKEKDQGDEKSQNDQNEDGRGQSDEEKPKTDDGALNIPPGAKTVKERIKTETTRDFLDDQGKVIGTDKNASEQEKTVPPEMLEKQQQSGQQQGEDKGKEEGEEKESKGKGKSNG